MEINSTEKISILLAALQERYNATHIIRARVENICTWTLGILVTAAGLFIGKATCLALNDKIVLSASLLAIFIILRFVFLRDLEKGFHSQFRAAARIEKILLLFDKGVYDHEPVYPENWNKSGQKDCDGKYFRSNYILLYLGFVIIMSSIWLF